MISTATVKEPAVSFQKINQEIGNIVKHAYTEFVDEYGRFLRFYSHEDYLIYLDERNLELIGRKS